MVATSKAKLEGNKRHQDKLYRVPVYIPKEEKDALIAHAKAQGYDSLNAYTRALYEADSGLQLTKKSVEE